jgi:RimJ/RimL family protein N-acetyltransferase
MVTTMFLSTSDYRLYGDWLNQQDDETLKMYFGISITRGFIRNFIDKIEANSDSHKFLVAFDNERWVGVLHMAIPDNNEVEFGFIVDQSYRGNGVADRLMDEGITWCQNRGFKRLFLHCLSWNQPIKHLCKKYGLELRSEQGDTEVNVPIPPPSLISIGKEFATQNRNIFTKIIEKSWVIQ